MALSSGKFVPVSALTTNHCLHTFNGQLALSLTEGCARVVSLTTRDGTFPVYDLEVEEDHTFTVTRLGIVVHNSTLPKVAKLACEFGAATWSKLVKTTDIIPADKLAEFRKLADGIIPTRLLKGEIGESIMRKMLEKEGFTMVSLPRHVNAGGLDGIFVKMVGDDIQVVVGEAKFWKAVKGDPKGYLSANQRRAKWIIDNYAKSLPNGGTIKVGKKNFTADELRDKIRIKINNGNYDFRMYHTKYVDDTKEFVTRLKSINK